MGAYQRVVRFNDAGAAAPRVTWPVEVQQWLDREPRPAPPNNWRDPIGGDAPVLRDVVWES